MHIILREPEHIMSLVMNISQLFPLIFNLCLLFNILPFSFTYFNLFIDLIMYLLIY